MSNAVATKPSNTLAALLGSDSAKKAIAAALPRHMTADRLMRVALTAANRNPKLLECTRESLWQAIMDCASLGLEPDALGRAYLIPYGKRVKVGNEWRETMQCQLVIGYKGRADLVMRSGLVDALQAQVVYSNDRFDFAYGLDETLVHKPALGDRGEPIGAYAYAKIKGGGFKMDWMSVVDVNRIRDRSQGYRQAVESAKKYGKEINSPWNSDWDEMAKKTVFNRLSKMLPMSSELADQIDRADRAEYQAPETTDDIEIKGDEAQTIDATSERMDERTAPPTEDRPAAPNGDEQAARPNPFGKGA